MRIEGYWNIYTCAHCGTEFAVSQVTDDDEANCPQCQEDENVDFRATDFVERY